MGRRFGFQGLYQVRTLRLAGHAYGTDCAYGELPELWLEVRKRRGYPIFDVNQYALTRLVYSW